MFYNKYSRYEFNDSLYSESPTESSDEEGHFSYSDLSPEYDEDSFDLDSGLIPIIPFDQTTI